MLSKNSYEYQELCRITSIEQGAIRGIDVIKLDCGKIKIDVDMISQINVFTANQQVKFIISKNKPEFTNNDFCAHGYVVTEKHQESYVTIISLFGPLIRIVSDESFCNKYNISIMDHVYVCIIKT
ncbi:DNA-directed RNA polymerase subunit G [Acidianus brierleyi]|uniref:DNA-directed RNA polymerase subunit Rpo8 n=1 Tax=Acidianus brierleyi TaxID=41673 RepID=A0A2U9IEQ5_9CREN|nr:DNA-directed RNA polymerase subunit G [Acidianus brierleyi]AWR94446.1 DNA-directed RNA polymerase subunit G [Acidianus brierleyi]